MKPAAKNNFFPSQFGLVRALGAFALLYFFVCFRNLFPLATHLVNGGTFPLSFLPVVGILASVLLLFGTFARMAAVVCLVCLNSCLLLLPVIAELHYPFLSLMLGTYAIFGVAAWLDWRPLGLRDELRQREIWYLPLLYSVFLGFTVMGVYKMFFPLWWNGGAVALLCPRGPLGSVLPVLCNWLPNRWIGFFVVFIEASSLPLAVFPRTRPLAWLLNVILHLSVSQFFYVRRISFVTLVMLLFLFDRRWVQQLVRPKSSATVF